MAKALLGHVGSDPRMAGDLRRLALRVRELERELVQARDINRALVAQLLDSPGNSLDVVDVSAELAEAAPALA